MKRTGRSHRGRPEKRRRPGTQREAAWPPRRRPISWEQVKTIVWVILGLILLYFYDKELGAAQRECEARGGRLSVDRSGHRCVLPGEPPAL